MQQKNGLQCKQCQSMLFDYVSDCTDAVQNKKMQEHLEHCPACRKEYTELTAMLSLLHEEPTAELPQEFHLELHRSLVAAATEMAEQKERSWIYRIKEMSALKTVVPAMLCLTLAIGVFASGLFEKWQSADSSVPVAVSEPIINTEKQQTEENEHIRKEETPTPVLSEPAKAVSAKNGSETLRTEAQSEQTTEASIEASQPALESSKSVPQTEQESDTAVEVQTAEDTESNAAKAFAGGGAAPMRLSAEPDTPTAVCEDSVAGTTATEDAVAVQRWYLAKAKQTISLFFDDAESATAVLWRQNIVSQEEDSADLYLTEEEWQTLSAYLQTQGVQTELLDVTDAEDGVIMVTIQGIEG